MKIDDLIVSKDVSIVEAAKQLEKPAARCFMWLKIINF